MEIRLRLGWGRERPRGREKRRDRRTDPANRPVTSGRVRSKGKSWVGRDTILKYI